MNNEPLTQEELNELLEELLERQAKAHTWIERNSIAWQIQKAVSKLNK